MKSFVTLQPIFKKEILIWNYLMTDDAFQHGEYETS